MLYILRKKYIYIYTYIFVEFKCNYATAVWWFQLLAIFAALAMASFRFGRNSTKRWTPWTGRPVIITSSCCTHRWPFPIGWLLVEAEGPWAKSEGLAVSRHPLAVVKEAGEGYGYGWWSEPRMLQQRSLSLNQPVNLWNNAMEHHGTSNIRWSTRIPNPYAPDIVYVPTKLGNFHGTCW